VRYHCRKQKKEAVVKKVRGLSIQVRVEKRAKARLVARINPERNPVLESYKPFPIRKASSTVRVPNKAEGNLAGKEEKPCQR
jgi:hypothetical protein